MTKSFSYLSESFVSLFNMDQPSADFNKTGKSGELDEVTSTTTDTSRIPRENDFKNLRGMGRPLVVYWDPDFLLIPKSMLPTVLPLISDGATLIMTSSPSNVKQ
jgi:hypothetical protein